MHIKKLLNRVEPLQRGDQDQRRQLYPVFHMIDSPGATSSGGLGSLANHPAGAAAE
jgi:hypothetical protein